MFCYGRIEWILCPVCGNKTYNQIREDTVLLNFPLYCLKCKQETLIKAKKRQVMVIEDFDKKRGNKAE
ncbi:MAG: cysteine-rich KTR domain-containing protein [Lachnospiraceae bacterium]|nr:cysteine-rich KTR domain-containing protein [Lachnospiraceae bacterium]